MRTAELDEIVRQRDAALKQVVEQFAKGKVGEAVQGLERQGRAHEVANRAERIAAVARSTPASPETRWSSRQTAAPAPICMKGEDWHSSDVPTCADRPAHPYRWPERQFLSQQRQEISARLALDHAMPPGQEHSQDFGIQKSIGYGFGINDEVTVSLEGSSVVVYIPEVERVSTSPETIGVTNVSRTAWIRLSSRSNSPPPG